MAGYGQPIARRLLADYTLPVVKWTAKLNDVNVYQWPAIEVCPSSTAAHSTRVCREKVKKYNIDEYLWTQAFFKAERSSLTAP